MVDALLKLSVLSLGFDALRVPVQTTRIFLVVELGSVNGRLRFSTIHEILCPVEICTRGCFVVLHDAVWCKHVVKHVGR